MKTFPWRRLLPFLVGVLILAFVIPPWIEERKDRVNKATHLRYILYDLHSFADGQENLPPAIIRDKNGKPLYSWRFQNAAFLLGDNVQYGYYGQVVARDQAWNEPGNLRYTKPPYRDYMGSPISYIDPTRPGCKARFVGVTGPDTAFDEDRVVRLKDLNKNCIIVVEVRNRQHHWMEPGGDLDIRTIAPVIGAEDCNSISGSSSSGFLVGFADCSVWLLSNDTPFERLKPFLTISGSSAHDRDAELSQYCLEKWSEK